MQQIKLAVIDGLRGAAVLLVLLSHVGGFGYAVLPFVNFQGIGKAGVYLFFVLSAWLLSRYLFDQRCEWGWKYWLGYGVRRVFRIFPLYSLVLFFCYVFTVLSVPYWVIPLNFDALIRHLALIDGRSVFWAIPVEFRFYLLLPALVVVITLISRLHRYLALAFCFGLILLPSLLPLGGYYESNTTHLWAYFSAFAVGLFISLLQSDLQNTRLRSPNSLIWSSGLGWLALILVALSIPDLGTHFAKAFGVLGAGAALPVNFFHDQVLIYSILWGLLLVAVLTGAPGLAVCFRSRPLVWIGERSFSIYLCHIPVLRLIRNAELNQPLLSGWLTVGLSLLLAHLLFGWVEKPGMLLGKKVSGRLQYRQKKVLD